MILVDLQQTMISNLFVSIGNHHDAEIREDTLRHMVLNSIRSYNMKFGAEYGEMIICCDDRNYWRKDLYPYYKAARKTVRDSSELDWNVVFGSLNKIREELNEFFPYRVIHINKAEADDIIGTIVHHEGTILSNGKPILILSGDKDFIQLHKYGNVKQFDPTRKYGVSSSNPKKYLTEHIIKGDKGDGIPNIFSQDNCLVMKIRQKTITEKRLKFASNFENLKGEVLRGWHRNSALIDLSKIPEDIKAAVTTKYLAENTKTKSKLFNYFIEKRLKHLMEKIGEF